MESPLSEAIEALGRTDEELEAVVHCDRLRCSKEQRYREGTVLAPTLCRFIPECKSLPHGKNGICHYSNLCVALDQMSSRDGEKWDFEYETFTFDSFQPRSPVSRSANQGHKASQT